MDRITLITQDRIMITCFIYERKRRNQIERSIVQSKSGGDVLKLVFNSFVLMLRLLLLLASPASR